MHARDIKETDKKVMEERAYQLAFQYEREHHYCSQCCLAALQDVFQIKDEGIFSASFALGGGLANTIEGTCGALAGGAMVISYLYGRSREEFMKGIPNKRAIYLVKKLYDRFIQEYGSCLCKDVQKRIFGRSLNFWDEKEKEIFEKSGGHIDKCPSVVAKTAKWTVEIICDEMQREKLQQRGINEHK
jgi:C_GCAxxG_C_C family probable redox protein